MRQHDVVLMGTGGKGVLSAGQILALAAMNAYRNVLWCPSYQSVQRGGTAECTIILADDDLPSPLLAETEALILMDPSQLAVAQKRMSQGALLLVESADLALPIRSDLRAIRVPAVEIAVSLGNIQASNFVLLGAYLAASNVLDHALVAQQIARQYNSKQAVAELDQRALLAGVDFVSKVPQTLS